MGTARRIALFGLCGVCGLCGLLLSGQRLTAQSPTFGLGHPPSPETLAAIDIEVTPDGRGAPSGSGTAAAGQPIYTSRCASCHGPSGKEGPQDVLVGGEGSLKAPARPLKTVGSYWPYATTLWDYIRRAMPFDHPGTLTADEVYATTAYILYINGIMSAEEVLNQSTLPRVKMPNRDGFVPDPRPDVPRPNGARPGATPPAVARPAAPQGVPRTTSRK